MRGALPQFLGWRNGSSTGGWLDCLDAKLTASVQRDAAGQPAYCIAIVQDISERTRLEAELREAHLSSGPGKTRFRT